MEIFNGQTADGDSAVVYPKGKGPWMLTVGNDFGGGTFSLILIDTEGNEITVPNTTVTTETVLKIDLPSNIGVKGNLNGASGADLDVFLYRL